MGFPAKREEIREGMRAAKAKCCTVRIIVSEQEAVVSRSTFTNHTYHENQSRWRVPVVEVVFVPVGEALNNRVQFAQIVSLQLGSLLDSPCRALNCFRLLLYVFTDVQANRLTLACLRGNP
jgi:hypothetical protein